jgi:ADP-heptose:LPS heptosyltransferase
VLITRLSHIGDCVLTLPMVSALRDHRNVHTTWLVESPTDQLLRGHDAVDDLVVVRSGWSRRPAKVFELCKRLWSRKFDIVIDPQSLTKSALPAWFAHAKRRIGFAKPHGRELAPILNNELVTATTSHLVDRSLELLMPLGIDAPAIRFSLPRDEPASQAMDDFLATQHLGCGFAIINPGAGWPSKKWPARWFGCVARHLGQEHQIPSVVTWAGEVEREAANLIVDKSGGHGILAPATSLLRFAELTRKAKFYLGGDTGPLHIAAACGTPCVGLYGPTDPAKCGPYGPDHKVVCPPNWKELFGKPRRHDLGPIRAIDVAQVIESCDEMVTQVGQQERQAA